MAAKTASKRTGTRSRRSMASAQNKPRSARLRQGGGGRTRTSGSASRGGTASSKSKSGSRSKTSSARGNNRSGGSGRRGSKALMTRDHEEIQRWAEERGGTPATVKGTARKGEEAGLLRIDFPGFSGAGSLEKISWDEFFEKFDEMNLTFLYDNDGGSRFNKFVCAPKGGGNSSKRRSANGSNRSKSRR
jgi:hypothetical protein